MSVKGDLTVFIRYNIGEWWNVLPHYAFEIVGNKFRFSSLWELSKDGYPVFETACREAEKYVEGLK